MRPIAIVGIGCRFAGGVTDPAGLWSLLTAGRDAITEVPRDRFDLDAVYSPEPAPGRLATRYGGFVDGVWEFDPGFFHISPREALYIDPQQRLLLQTVWEALADAGIAPSTLAGTSAGVFVALHLNEYAQRCGSARLDLTALTGSARNSAAGRISYALNTFGPAMVFDTDRSSGLVALHNACNAIENGECDSAIVGGANLILSPDVSIAFSAAGMLAPDGRCKFGDSSANGFVRAEGIAAIILRPLDHAVKDGQSIYGVIRGSAVLTSGNLSGDLMTPSSEAQARLVSEACRRAGVSPAALSYIEAHGTGTPIGDTVELLALERVVGGTERKTPCRVGSVKTNIGHTEACAGLAGLIKVALIASRREIPASLHFRRFPEALATRDLGLLIPTSLESIPDDVELVAGVSSFGLTGINAHAIISEPPRSTTGGRQLADAKVDAATATKSEAAAWVLPISTNHRDGLRALASRYLPLVKDEAVDLGGVCHSAALRRDHLAHRAAFVGRSRADLVAALESFSNGSAPDSAFITGKASTKKAKVVFVFPGQGSHWVGMSRELYASNRVFAEKLDQCDRIVREIAGWSPIEELRLPEPRFAHADVVQPLLLVMELCLHAVWTSWGVRPDAVIGTSMGEVAAAHAAGALTLEQTLRLICERGRLCRSIAGRGATAVVELPAREAMARLDPTKVSIASVNSPTSTLISGDRVAVEEAVKAFEADKIFAQLVRMDMASHSAQVDPILPALADVLQSLMPTDTTIPFYSTVHAEPVAGSKLTADYWVKNLRMPIEFSSTIQRLLSEEHDVFIEIAPHPVLRSPLLDNVSHARREAVVVGTLRRNEDEVRSAFESLCRLHVSGYPVDWSRILPERPFQRIPVAPWHQATFRVDPEANVPVAEVELRDPPPAAEAQTSFVARLKATPAAARIDLMTDTLRAELATVLETPADGIELDRPFRDLGLTSLAGTEFRAAIGSLLERTYPSALLFNYANVRALAAHLCAEIEPDESARADQVSSAKAVAQPNEPIAIIGIAMRFPGGVVSGETLWDLLKEGRDTITEIPSDRWDVSRVYDPNPRAPGKMYTKWGSFVEDIGHFDPEFFETSAREAETMDPQQRLLLELSWQALENAGISRSSLLDSATGVFVGMMNTNEYSRRKNVDSQLDRVTPHTSTGDAMSIAAGRISFFFGFQGPAITIDTACSSSLVALHVAAASLRLGECRAALVGGVNLIASPSTTMSFAKTRMLSPRGRCRTFDASADGYVRAEGGCVLVLKRLSDAIADNDDILGVVRGSAINQDGRSSGLTAPNGVAQKALIERALSSAGVAASEVSYTEAHGTGTALGDPIEVQALADTYRASHDASNPLYLGAVKANFGHMEACAGLVGVAKVLLLLKHRELPRQANLEKVNPNLGLPDWMIIPREHQPWSPGKGRFLAGVSSFGFSGTNAHVILESADALQRQDDRPRHEAPVVCLSAVSAEGLQRVAAQFVESLPSEPSAVDTYDLAYTSACRREHFEFRAAFVGSPDAVRRRLEAIAEGRSEAGVFGPEQRLRSPKIAFLYTGLGSSYPGMGRALYVNERAFRAAFDQCNPLASERNLSLTSILFGDRSTPLQNVEAQVGLFTLQYALTQMWAAWGIAPSCVLGHSVGEYAAACAAGMIELDAAFDLVVRSGTLIDELRLPAEIVDGGLGLHSPAIDPILPQLAEASSRIVFSKPRTTFVSTVTGNVAADEPTTASYFGRVLREPARLVDGVRALARTGCNVFIEVGPRQTLLQAAQETIGATNALWLPSLSEERSDLTYTSEVVAQLFASGLSIDWDRFYEGHEGKLRALPPYPLSRRRFWLTETSST